MSTRTVTYTVSSPVSSPIELLVTLPNDPTSKKIPITVILGSKNSDHDDKEPMSLASYHYAIPYRDTKDVVGTALLDTNDDWIRDITRQVATIIAKKFQMPCYVGWASAIGLDGRTSIDQLFVIKQCIQFLSQLLTK